MNNSDNLTKEQRHKNMKNIHGADTKPEIVLRKALWHKGYRYRKNWNKLPGKPDIVLTRRRFCIFVDSEFFHGKGYYGDYESNKYSSLREQLENSNNVEYWTKKITYNMEHDEKINAELNGLGWTVIRFWSKDVLKDTGHCIKTIEEFIENGECEEDN